MNDIFYEMPRPTLKKVKNILVWADKNGIKTDVDMLDCSKSFCRVASDKTFEEVLGYISKGSLGFFRVVFRQQNNVFGLFSSVYERRDYLEVFIRSIDVGQVEYFIFIYMEPEKLGYLKNKYSLKEIS